MKKLTLLILAIVLLQCSACISDSNESATGSDNASGTQSSTTEAEDTTIDRAGYRTAVSLGCSYSMSRSPAVADSGKKLTDGAFETVGLNTDRFLGFSGNVDIVIDLGDRLSSLADFEVHYFVQSGKAKEPSRITVAVSDDGKEYTQVGSIVPASHPNRADGLVDSAVIALEKSVSGRYIKYSVNTKNSNPLLIQELIAFTYTSVTAEGEKPQPEYTTAPESITADIAYPTWSFETLMPMIGATDEEWKEHFDYLQNARFEGLVVLSSAGYDGSLMSASTIERCLKECQDRGMKVFMGINLSKTDENYLVAGAARDEFLAGAKRCVATIYNSYKTKYPDALYGWYLNYEFSNSAYNQYPDGCADFINGIIAVLNETDPTMPMLMSPYNTSWGGSPAQLKTGLSNVFSKVSFRSFDIYCPQDAVGAGLIPLSSSADYFKAMKECCDEKGIELWANVENFIIQSSVPGFEADTIAAPISRFAAQLEAVKPYITGCSTFTFEAYTPDRVSNYTIYTDVDFYYNNYLYYLNTGRVKEEAPPQILEITASEPVNNYITITLKLNTPAYHIMAVAYDLSGTTHTIGRYYMTEIGAYTYLSFREYVGNSNDKGLIYSFTAYDFSSFSSKTKLYGYNAEVKDLFVYDIDRTKPEAVVSAGCTYTSSIQATHSNGDSGTELTDGKRGSSNDFGDSAWSGYNAPVSFTLDLGETVEAIADVRISMLGGGLGAIYEPSSIKIFVSDDNTSFYSIGEISSDMAADGTLYSVVKSIELEFGVSARYIKLDIQPTGWFFLDEIEVVKFG